VRFLICVLFFPALAHADNKKSGTFDLSGGPGIVHADSRGGVDLGGDSAAWEAIGLGVGYFIHPNLSVTLRASHMFLFRGGAHAFIAFHGASVQWYVHRRVFLGVGPGFVTYGGAGAFAAQAGGETDRSGFGMHFRVGVTVIDGKRHALNAYVQMYPGFFKDGSVVATGLGIEWQIR